ncbi:sugar phosphate isomerase/epimerase [Aestuariicella hydrocarbonica]|uniref:Sugar phosphate isomerase/epimerase n=1 Tax=Pseudomaricurvus hydrocarbonicus TaxID=1470433 RepID=A0A9E5JVI8_9GAMM|nr:sugar phosphate isomerase/epimerase family protein [Aestuariicella hydrocarbonica]NHO65665.1 sugar phosphate isomerase/epimerase [Aestuariicella hydrocarbonica]
MLNKRLSVNALSTFNWSFEQDLALWKELGVHHAGLLISKVSDDLDGKLSRMMDENIQPSTLVCGSFSLSAPEKWTQEQDQLNKMMDIIASVDPNCSIYFPPGRTTGAPWDEVMAVFSESVAPCVTHAASVGVQLAFEPSLRTDASFINTLRDAVDVSELTGLGLVVDFGNCWMERNLRETLLRAGPQITLVQIDDVAIGSHNQLPPGRRVHIGDGDLPLDRLMGDILDSGYQGVFDLEVLGPAVEQEGYEQSLRRGVVTASDLISRMVDRCQ